MMDQNGEAAFPAGIIHALADEAHQTAINHGWWDTDPEFGTLIALCHSELSEALQEYRQGAPIAGVRREHDSPEGVPIELADCVIRIFDICGKYGIDLERAIRVKMTYNKARPWRHGGKII